MSKTENNHMYLSDCHKAPLRVVNADEETSHYECSECGFPCDVVVKDPHNASQGQENVRLTRGDGSEGVDSIVDEFSVHRPKGTAKGTVARRSLKKSLRREVQRLVSLEREKSETHYRKKHLKVALGALPEKSEHNTDCDYGDGSDACPCGAISYNICLQDIETQLHKELGGE